MGWYKHFGLVCGLTRYPRDLNVKSGLKEENPHLAMKALVRLCVKVLPALFAACHMATFTHVNSNYWAFWKRERIMQMSHQQAWPKEHPLPIYTDTLSLSDANKIKTSGSISHRKFLKAYMLRWFCINVLRFKPCKLFQCLVLRI